MTQHILDETHNPAVQSWLPAANLPGNNFPIQNLPFGIFRRAGSAETARVGVAIGDQILDLAACARAALLDGPLACYHQPALNHLLALGRPFWQGLRQTLSALLRADAAPCPELLVPQVAAELLVPATIGDYTDAYASIHHATRVGSLFRPDNPLLPNYRHVPIAYHGRASSIVVSGTPLRRPHGQQRPDPTQPPLFGPCTQLDYEAEVGMLIGPGNPPGQPVALAAAEDQIFGLCLVNDWSARDMQRWEYQPLGPFLSKSFATSLSPWVVTLEALAPFRTAALPRSSDDPPLLAYLADPINQQQGGVALTLDVAIQSAQMRAAGCPPLHLSHGSAADLYWTIGQLVAHHTSNGCNLRPGDLIASGTVSGAALHTSGCLLELTSGGQAPIMLPTGEQRRFLEDGDEVMIEGYCEQPGFVRIGFGACIGRVIA